MASFSPYEHMKKYPVDKSSKEYKEKTKALETRRKARKKSNLYKTEVNGATYYSPDPNWKPTQQATQESLWQQAFAIAYNQKLPQIQREFNKGYYRQEEKRLEEKAEFVREKGYHTIIKKDRHGRAELEIVVPEEKQKALNKEAEIEVGKRIYEKNPVSTSARYYWFNPVGFLTSTQENRYQDIARLSAQQEATQNKYGTAFGTIINSATSPAFTTIASFGGGQVLGSVSGKLAIESMTGNKLAGVGSIVLSSASAVGGGIGTGMVAKSIVSDQLTISEKANLLTQFSAGVVAGGMGYKAGYKSIVDPYFQVQNVGKGSRESGMVYGKDKGIISKERTITYKEYNGKQFEANLAQQQSYRTKKLSNNYYAKVGNTITESTITGKNLKTGTSGTSIFINTQRDLGLIHIEQQQQMGKINLVGGKVYGYVTGGKGIYQSDFVSLTGTKGAGVTLSDSWSYDPKANLLTYEIGDTTKFRPMAERTSIWADKKGSMSMTGTLTNFDTTIIKSGFPKTNTIPLIVPTIITGNSMGILTGAGVGIGGNLIQPTPIKQKNREINIVSSPIINITTPQPITKPITITSQKADTITDIIIETKTEKKPNIIDPNPDPIIDPTPGVPNFFFWPAGIGFGKKAKRPDKKKSRHYGYTASLSAALLGITSTKKPTKKMYSGFEVRPVIISKSKKKKRGLL